MRQSGSDNLFFLRLSEELESPYSDGSTGACARSLCVVSRVFLCIQMLLCFSIHCYVMLSEKLGHSVLVSKISLATFKCLSIFTGKSTKPVRKHEHWRSVTLAHVSGPHIFWTVSKQPSSLNLNL